MRDWSVSCDYMGRCDARRACPVLCARLSSRWSPGQEGALLLGCTTGLPGMYRTIGVLVVLCDGPRHRSVYDTCRETCT